MSKRRLSLIGAMILVTFSNAPSLAGPIARSTSFGEAVAVVERFHAALKSGDSAAAASLLDDAAVIYEEGEAELSKAQYVANHLPADIAFTAAVPESVTRRDGGAEAPFAWVATRGRLNGKFHGRAISRATTETMVLRRESVGWRIVHVHWSSRAAK